MTKFRNISLVLIGIQLLLAPVCVFAFRATEQGYVEVADILAASVDLSADPCNNFKQYACGTYNYTGSNWFRSKERNTAAFDEYLKGQNPRFHDDFPTNQAVRMFHACQEAVQMPGKMPTSSLKRTALPFIEEMGGWPTLTEGWRLPEIYDTASALDAAMTRRLDIVWTRSTTLPHLPYGLYAPYVRITSDNSEHLFHFGGPRTTTRRLDEIVSFFTGAPAAENSIRDLYTSQAQMVATMMGQAVDADALAHDAADVDAFYNELVARVMAGFGPNALKGEAELTMYEASQRWPNLNLGSYLYHLADDGERMTAILGGKVKFPVTPYFDWLNERLQTLSARTYTNYLMFNIITFTQIDVQAEQDHAKTDESGCVGYVLAQLPMLMTRVYMDMNGLRLADFVRVRQAMGTITHAWRGQIARMDWLQPESREKALLKLTHMDHLLAFDEGLLDMAALREYYSLLDFEGFDDFAMIVWKFYKWNAWTRFEAIETQPSRASQGWILLSPASVNAWNYRFANVITLPVGMMAAPLFDRTHPLFDLYSQVGWVVGHEIGHGFDRSGLFFDENGVWNSTKWMHPDDLAVMEPRFQCLADQQNTYCMTLANGTQVCPNGRRQVIEATADLTGLIATYKAFRAVRKLSADYRQLPGGYGALSELNTDQLFFVSAAQLHCNNYGDEDTIKFMSTVHPHPTHRIEGSMRQFRAFGRAFNCTRGQDFMMPQTRCKIWE